MARKNEKKKMKIGAIEGYRGQLHYACIFLFKAKENLLPIQQRRFELENPTMPHLVKIDHRTNTSHAAKNSA